MIRTRLQSQWRVWWTRERVIEALRRFYREFKTAPTATDEWQRLTAGTAVSQHGVGNPYPSSYGVLKHFANFRAAWRAAGVKPPRCVPNTSEAWTADEDWFLAEAIGILTRVEIAAYLERTPEAVHRRIYDLGLNTRTARGWTAHRLARATGVTQQTIRTYMERGELPYYRGTRLIYLDPADCLVVAEIDWENPPEELERAVRSSLMGRLAKLLAGEDWRAGRLYQPHRTRKTDRPRRKSPTRRTAADANRHALKGAA